MANKVVNNILITIGAVVAVAFGLFLGSIASTFVGIVGGFFVGIFFEGMILDVISRFGLNVEGLTLWQLGGAIGFVGSFFKAFQTNTNKAK